MKRLIALLTAMLWVMGSAAAEDRVLTLNLAATAGTPHHESLRRVAVAACAAVGVECRLVTLPLPRAVDAMLHGSIDGEVGRIREFGEQPETRGVYLLVDVPFLPVGTRVMNRIEEAPVSQWSELDGKKVGYLRGTLYYKKRLSELAPNAGRIEMESSAQCPKMIVNRRIDACLADDWSALAPEIPAEDKDRLRLGDTLEQVECYLFLSARHADLIAAFERALKAD